MTSLTFALILLLLPSRGACPIKVSLNRRPHVDGGSGCNCCRENYRNLLRRQH